MTQETMWIVLEEDHVTHDPHTPHNTPHKGVHFLEISEAESHVWIEFIQYYSAGTGGNSRDCRKHKTVFLEAPNLPNIHLPWRASWGCGRRQSASPRTLAPFHSTETHHSDRLKAFKIRKLFQRQRIHTGGKP